MKTETVGFAPNTSKYPYIFILKAKRDAVFFKFIW